MKQSSSSSKESRPKVVAAIPCFNTQRFIKDIVSRASRHVDQVIAVDDGSSDGTAEAARAAGALVVSHSQNRGYGEALNSCLEAARVNGADVLVVLDGDGQHNPDEIPRLLAPILQGEADLVIGSRFLNKDVHIPRHRKFGIKVITLLFNLGAKTKVSDAQSGFRAYRSNLFSHLTLTARGMSISIETLEKARRGKAIIKEVPVSCQYAPSTLNLKIIKHGLAVALSVVKFRGQSLLGS